MPIKKSSESVETIVSNPEAIPDEPESLAEEVEVDAGIERGLSPRASDFIGEAQLQNVRSVSEAREAAHIPPHFPVKELEGRALIFVHKRDQKAVLRDTGELRNGYFCLCKDAETLEDLTTWIGQTILMRELTMLEMPFKATIVKRGRTYMFADN